MDRQLIFGAQTANPNTSPVSGNNAVAIAVTSRGVVRVDMSAGGIAIPGLANNADNVAPTATLQNIPVVSYNYVFDGTNFDRLYSGSAANLSSAAAPPSMLATQPGEWAIQSSPAAGVQATISRAAVAAQRHVCKGFSITLNAVGAIVVPVVVNVRDGGTGAGTILWSGRFTAPAGTTVVVTRDNLNLIGSVNTAMTIEFAAAPAAGDFQNVAMNGFTAS